MSLEKATINWNLKQLAGMVANGKANMEHIVQRGLTWEKSRKSWLIHSLIMGYPVPPVFAKRMDDGIGRRSSNIYYIMDGKQRLTTIKEFIYDEFALTVVDPVVVVDELTGEKIECEITGKKFSELPELIQNHLYTVSVQVTYFDNLNSEEEREMFKRLNAGKPLSTKSRLLASCKDIEGLLNIGSHTLFNEMLTDKARSNKNQVAMVMKAWCMLNEDTEDVSFESKDFNPMLENAEVTEEEKNNMVEVFDKIVSVHNILIEKKQKKVAKKLYTETHMISLVPFISKALETGICDEAIADWLIDFYNIVGATSVSDDYNNACTNGAAKSHNIVARHNALSNSFDKFAEEYDADKYTEFKTGFKPESENENDNAENEVESCGVNDEFENDCTDDSVNSIDEDTEEDTAEDINDNVNVECAAETNEEEDEETIPLF